jgi:hypothetical protein
MASSTVPAGLDGAVKRGRMMTVVFALLAVALAASSVTGYGLRGGVLLLPHAALCLALAAFVLARPSSLFSRPFPHEVAGFAFIAVTAAAALVAPNSRSAVYLIVYAVTFVGFLYLLRQAIASMGPWRQRLLNINMYAVFAFAALCIVEFMVRGYLRIEINEYLPRLARGVATCALLIPRTYALAIEPTYLAWYFNTLGLLGLAHLWRGASRARRAKIGLSILFVVAYMLTFAVAAGISLGAGVAITIAYFAALGFGDRFARLREFAFAARQGAAVGATCISAGVAVYLLAIYAAGGAPNVASCMGRGVSKAQLTLVTNETRVVVPQGVTITPGLSTTPPPTAQAAPGGATSADGSAAAPAPAGATPSLSAPPAAVAAQPPSIKVPSPTERIKVDRGRSETWERDIRLALQKPWLGWGPGYKASTDEYSSLSLLLFVGLEQGVFAALTCLLVFVLAFRKIDLVQSPLRNLYLVTFAAGAFHLMTMTQHFYTNLWLLLALALTADQDAAAS